MVNVAHLASRFIGSLWPFGPSGEDSGWAKDHLLPAEATLWDRMARADRRHSIAVARRVDRTVDDAPREVIAAALLHDVGKIESQLGTLLRVVATLSAAIAGRDTADLWVRSRGVTRRIGLYLKHPEIGADTLAMAGSDPLTVAWTREHHLPQDRWTVEARFADALAAADDD